MKTQKSARKLLAVLGFFGLLNACGQATSHDSDLKVTNGIEISEDAYASVVLLVSVSEKGQSICTGTFVNDRQVVTAGHCVYKLDPSDPSIYFVRLDQDGKAKYSVKAEDFNLHPDYDMSVSNGVNPQDLAVVDFPEQTAPSFTSLAYQTPRVGSNLTIVGYGNNRNFFENGKFSGSGAGTKRVGSNQLRDNSGGFLSFYGLPESNGNTEAGVESASSSGDSGGPMLVDGRLAGVTSGGGMRRSSSGSYIKVSHYVDLNSWSSRQFLESVLQP